MTQKEQKLKDFLISKGAFDAYMKNIQSEDCEGTYTYEDYTVEDYGEIPPLVSAFWWEDTPQGADYWDNLNDEYNNTK